MNDAVRWRYLPSNEAAYVKPFKIQKREPSFWSRDESQKFVELVKSSYSEYYPVFALAIYTGMRKGEIRALKWDCVDLSSGSILVKRHFCEIKKEIVERTKGKDFRRIPINAPLRQMLVEQRNKVGKDNLVAPDFNWRHPHRLMAQLCKEAEVTKIRFHDLRHNFASHLVMSGKPLYEVQHLLGHADIQTTQKYAHLAPDHLRGATDCLDFESGA